MSYFFPRVSLAPALAAPPLSHNHSRAAELLRRYPDLSRPQRDELVALFPRLRPVDVALMMADDTLAPRLDAFCSANRNLVSPSLSDYAVIGAILSFPLLALLVLLAAN